MAWFAAHAIMYCKLKEVPQDKFTVWENVLLIEAPDGKTAWRLAEERAREDESDDSASMTWEGHAATWVYAGIRKIIEVSHSVHTTAQEPGHGDEVTYSEFMVSNLSEVEALVAGKPVLIEYAE